MNPKRNVTAGIISCPGAEQFSRKICYHISRLAEKFAETEFADGFDDYDQIEDNYERELKEMISDNDPDCYRDDHCNISKVISTGYTRFANGEIKVEIGESIRGRDIYIIADVMNQTKFTFSKDDLPDRALSPNDYVMIIMMLVEIVKASSALSITLILPAYPYARQHDRRSREPLTAALISRFFETLGVERIFTLDIHSTSIENSFFQTRIENLHASFEIIEAFLNFFRQDQPYASIDEMVVVSPDIGAVERSRFFAAMLGCPLVLIYKTRNYSKTSEIKLELLGDVEGRTIFMPDDIVGTGTTMLREIKLLKEKGASHIYCAASLPLFNKNCEEKFDEYYQKNYLKCFIGTNAVRNNLNRPDREKKYDWYYEVDISILFAKAVNRCQMGLSISTLLERRKKISVIIDEFRDNKKYDLFDN